MPRPLAHISSLKHLIDLKLERNPNFKAGSAPDAGAAPESRFHCPVTGLDFNGRFRFVVLRPSGHVVSERAIKQVGGQHVRSRDSHHLEAAPAPLTTWCSGP